ncbi:octapeptide-repeat protein T2-like [Ambystoma mexicanum]|uniref:octapeptide-repeat protein T2-like n=1 Tax=Ambystoma mexicanum TaxID=8296 RepID=UPI0037E8E1E3
MRELRAAEGYSNLTYKPPPYTKEDKPKGIGQPASGEGVSNEALQQRVKEELEGMSTNKWIAAQVLLKLQGKTKREAERATEAIESLNRGRYTTDWAELTEGEDRREKDREVRLEREDRERRREEKVEQEDRERRREEEKEHLEREREKRIERHLKGKEENGKEDEKKGGENWRRQRDREIE